LTEAAAYKSGWLSLRVSESNNSGTKNQKKPAVFISIPKKHVVLATKRNRLKRLIREVIRSEPFFKRSGAVFFIRVNQMPASLEFPAVKEAIQQAEVNAKIQ
jgi:ribonuclease P protein component